MPPLDLQTLVGTAMTAPLPEALRDQCSCFVELDARGMAQNEVLLAAREVRAANGPGVCVDAKMVEVVRRAMQDATPVMIVRLNEAQGDDIAAIAAEAGACAGDGAGAVEFLVPLSAVEDGDVGLVGDLIEACRTTAGPGVALRILTPGGSVDPSMATAIARTAIMAGVDFLGVTMPSASGPLDLDLCAVLLSVAMEAEGKVGFKLSQGKSALAPLASLAQAILGPEWLRPANIRVEERHFVTRFQQ